MNETVLITLALSVGLMFISIVESKHILLSLSGVQGRFHVQAVCDLLPARLRK